MQMVSSRARAGIAKLGRACLGASLPLTLAGPAVATAQLPRGVVADGTAAEPSAAAQTAAPPTADQVRDQYEDGRPIAGVEVHVRVWHSDAKAARDAVARALREVERITAKLAPDGPASEIASINKTADHDEVILSTETFGLLNQALEVCRESKGAFDPTVGAYDYLWNFRHRPAVRPLELELQARKGMIGCEYVSLKPGRIVRLMRRGARLRMSDMAHGAAMQAAAAALRDAGIHNFRLRVGADVYVAGRTGTRHWYVAVQHPDDPKRDLVQLYLTSHAAATRHWAEHSFVKDGQRYHDVIDPRSGKPASGVAMATVIGNDPVVADALSAAVFVLGPREGIRLIERTERVEGFVIDDKGKVWGSSGMSDYARLPETVDL